MGECMYTTHSLHSCIIVCVLSNAVVANFAFVFDFASMSYMKEMQQYVLPIEIPSIILLVSTSADLYLAVGYISLVL